MIYKLSALIAFAVFIFPCAVLADDMERTGEIVLEKGKSPMPTSFIKTTDNGFIIIGTTEHATQTTKPSESTSKALAVKIDSKGNVIWRYVVSDSVDLNGDTIKYARMNPIYSSAAEMQDGSIFICGTAPSGEKTFGQLTHLDKNGKLIDKQSILPVGFETSGFDSCIAWGDGFAAVGYAFKTEPKQSLDEIFKDKSTYDRHFANLITYIGRDGHPKWVKTTPLMRGISAYSIDLNPLQPVSDNGIVFVKESTGAGRGSSAQIVRFNRDGQISTRLLDQRFLLALPTNGEKDIQLVSATDSYPRVRVKLNDNLQEVSREPEKVQLENYGRNIVYRMPDQSLIIFGSIYGIGNFPHVQTAGVIMLDPTMQHVSTLSVSPDQYSAYVQFAVPLSRVGEFACERWVNPFYRQEELMKLMQSSEFEKLDLAQRKKIGIEWESDAIKRSGIALDFVRVN